MNPLFEEPNGLSSQAKANLAVLLTILTIAGFAFAAAAKTDRSGDVEHTLKLESTLCEPIHIVDPSGGKPEEIAPGRNGSSSVRMPKEKAPTWIIRHANGSSEYQEIIAVRTPLVFAENEAGAKLVSVTYRVKITGNPEANLPTWPGECR